MILLASVAVLAGAALLAWGLADAAKNRRPDATWWERATTPRTCPPPSDPLDAEWHDEIERLNDENEALRITSLRPTAAWTTWKD